MDFSSTAPLPFSDVRIIIPDECVCQPDGENLFFFIKIRLLPIFFFAFLRLSFTEKILYTIYRFFPALYPDFTVPFLSGEASTGGLLRDGSPCTHLLGAPPQPPGDFLPDEKVTKESPRGVSPLGTPLKGEASLPLQHIVLLPPQKGFRHNKRPICHFELVGKSVFFLPKLYRGSHFPFSIRGTAGMPRGCLRA